MGKVQGAGFSGWVLGFRVRVWEGGRFRSSHGFSTLLPTLSVCNHA